MGTPPKTETLHGLQWSRVWRDPNGTLTFAELDAKPGLTLALRPETDGIHVDAFGPEEEGRDAAGWIDGTIEPTLAEAVAWARPWTEA